MRSIPLLVIAVGLTANLLWAFDAADPAPAAHAAPSGQVEAPRAPALRQAMPAMAERVSARPAAATRSHLVAVPLDFAEPDAPAGNPALERAFAAEPEDAERAARVTSQARAVLAADPELEVHDV